MNIWEFIDQNPGWTLGYLIVICVALVLFAGFWSHGRGE